jgi:hypothetical protein
LVFNANITTEARIPPLKVGAKDFLFKQRDLTEIRLRARNFLDIRSMHQLDRCFNEDLEKKVAERTQALMGYLTQSVTSCR